MPARRQSRLALLVIVSFTAVTLVACSASPTPILSQRPGAGALPGGQPAANASPGATPTTGGPTPAPAGTAAPASIVPADLVGTWRSTVGGAAMTKVLRADATYTETWADSAKPCQAEGTLTVIGDALALTPKTTNCTWSAVVYRYSVDGGTLALLSGGIDQQYQRA